MYQILTEVNWKADSRVLLPFASLQLNAEFLIKNFGVTEVWADANDLGFENVEFRSFSEISANGHDYHNSNNKINIELWEESILANMKRIEESNVQVITERKENGVCGGTFDHLHAGHKLLLTVCALTSSKHLTIGITAEEMLKNKKYREHLQNFDVRERLVRNFYFSIQPSISESNYDLFTFPLNDPYGPTLVSETLQVIVVSKETESWTQQNVNPVRIANSLSPLLLISVPLLLPPSHLSSSDKLSSTQLRST